MLDPLQRSLWDHAIQIFGDVWILTGPSTFHERGRVLSWIFLSSAFQQAIRRDARQDHKARLLAAFGVVV